MFCFYIYTEPIETINSECSVEACTLVSDMKPVYMCNNAIQRNHTCTYALCYACKEAEDNRKNDRQDNPNAKRRSARTGDIHDANEKSMRERLNNKYDDDNFLDPEDLKKLCRHADRRTLQPFTMVKYFEKDYQARVQSNNIHFPIDCTECGFRLKRG